MPTKFQQKWISRGTTVVSEEKMIDIMTSTAKFHQVTSSTCPCNTKFPYTWENKIRYLLKVQNNMCKLFIYFSCIQPVSKDPLESARAEDGPVGTLARIKINTPMKTMTIKEMQTAFRELTGESLKECIQMVGGTGNVEDETRKLLHHAIIYANVDCQTDIKTWAKMSR